MNSTKYTGGLIDSGRIRRLFKQRIDEIENAKQSLQEKIYPNAGNIRPKRFIVLQTNDTIEARENSEIIYHNIRVVIIAEGGKRYNDYGYSGCSCVIEGTKSKNSKKFEVLHNSFHHSEDISNTLIEKGSNSPREIMRILRRLEAVRDWYIARRKGQERGANEILKQQDKWVKALENELAMESLKE